MATITIRGVPVSFPFKPYDIQKDYMEKVIECLQNRTNGVLESPTGTGKTLSLLCSSLAWLSLEKVRIQSDNRMCGNLFATTESKALPGVGNLSWNYSTIVYASRTHSQLTQAMQELKRTSYSHVRATILGSREQLCIHPDVVQQVGNTNKTCMCNLLVKEKRCYLQNRVEKMTLERQVQELNISDVEDLVKLGQKHKFCPYYMARELKNHADILFVPYNYLLDPKARRANNLNLKDCIIILDEAHNVEKICEDSASFQLKTTDIALCIDELTAIMKSLTLTADFSNDGEKDFTAEDVALFKTMLLNLEKIIDDIPLPKSEEGATYEGKYIFEIFEKAGINNTSQGNIRALIASLIKFMSANRDSPFQRAGDGLQMLEDLLLILFQKTSDEFKEKVNKCFKVHLINEVEKKKSATSGTWLSKATPKEKTVGRILSYWCFSPSFGMQMLLEQGVRCIILTSGTLAPLKPLISELGLNVGVRLECPHVVTNKQICVKILGTGPDGVPLNSGFQNRQNQKYISSLGMTVLNISRQVPSGLLIFFPSYALLSQCQENWQQSGIWTTMNELKQIFIEPKTKDTFNTVMSDFYERVKNPEYKGATFMAVCRGKVSEGLDFADINGRAVIVTGLPYPPFKDPRVVLKKKYLDVCRAQNSEYISGQDWYGLEATRAVNQAIGRVIRHQYDYGAILLLDNRFNNSAIKNQLSLWIRGYVKMAQNFGEVIRDMRVFFKNAVEFDGLRDQQKIRKSSMISNPEDVTGLVKIHALNKQRQITEASTSSYAPNSENNTNANNEEIKENIASDLNKRSRKPTFENLRKKMKFTEVDYSGSDQSTNYSTSDLETFVDMMKKNLGIESYQIFIKGLGKYKESNDFNVLIIYLNQIFLPKAHLRYLIQGLDPYIESRHKDQFTKYWNSMRL